MSRPDFAARLRAGETLVGAWCSLPGPGPAELLAAGGVDYVVLDLQHGLLGEGDLPPLFPAIEAHGAAPLVRLRANDPVAIGRVLDLGAEGIVVPNVDSVEEARSAVRATLYPPRGTRGFGPVRAAPDARCRRARGRRRDRAGRIARRRVACVESSPELTGLRRSTSVRGISRSRSACRCRRTWTTRARGRDRPRPGRGRRRRPSRRGALDPRVRRRRLAAAGWRLVNVVDDVTALRDAVAAGLRARAFLRWR